MQIMHFINKLFCSKISNSWHNNIIFDFLTIRFDFKIIEIKSGFKSISRIEIDRSGRFQYLEPKPDPTINLDLGNMQD